MSAPLRIHHFPLSGHAHRAVLFASLAGLAHDLVEVDLAKGAHKEPAFLKLNPYGQVPALEDGDVALGDSNAILVYLAKKYAPDWLPEDPLGAAQVQRMLSLAAGDIANGPAAARLVTVFNADLDPERAKAIAERAFTFLEAHLEDRDWLVGERPTIADVAVYSYTAHAPEGNVSLDPYPRLRQWLARVEALPGFVAMPATAVGLAA